MFRSPKEMLRVLKDRENLTLIEALVDNLIIQDNKVVGVELNNQERLMSKAVVITTGTYLASNILIGTEVIKRAADGQPTTFGISQNLRDAGFDLIRLKTATPPRVKRDTIDISDLEVQYGDEEPYTFSHDEQENVSENKEVCYITRDRKSVV